MTSLTFASADWLAVADQYEILATAPRHYAVHLNRHTPTGQLDKSGVMFDDTLDLSFAAGENKKCSWLYQLYAVCFHIGSTSNTGASIRLQSVRASAEQCFKEVDFTEMLSCSRLVHCREFCCEIPSNMHNDAQWFDGDRSLLCIRQEPYARLLVADG